MEALWQDIWKGVQADFSDLPDAEAVTQLMLRMLLAILLGGILGYQRERQGKDAGVRTHMLVALGSAFFVLIPLQSGMPLADMSRVLQGLITGIGFLGAGAILKQQNTQQIHGLTTAAGLWLTASGGHRRGPGTGNLGHLGDAAGIHHLCSPAFPQAVRRCIRGATPGGSGLKRGAPLAAALLLRGFARGRGGQEAGGVLHWAAMTERLYAYLDESGQETEGRIFIVCAVVVGSDRDALLGQLEAIEARSRKGRVKWHHARPACRQAYLHELVHLDRLQGCLFVSVFHDTRRYREATAVAAARAIRLKARDRYKVTVLVDGLQRTERRAFAQELRSARVNPYKVRGVLKEENNAMIRLADALCGLVRDAEEGQAWARDMAGRMERRGFLIRA